MKTVLITGATGAIGKATALELAKNNCHLILLGRNSEKLETVKAEIQSVTSNQNIDVALADLSEPKEILMATKEIRQKYSLLNALINVAGTFRKKRMENSQGNEYMFAANHLGPFILTNELLDLLTAGKPARIVNLMVRK